ncbi:MAG: DUF4870 domain-containing protein [Vicinamibacteria bacterium]
MTDNQTKLGVAPNVGGLLCYVPCCIGFIVSIVVAVIEKENKFLRFHAFQSLLVHAAAIVCGIAFWILSMIAGMIFGLLALGVSLVSLLVSFGFLGALIFMMIKANNNEEYKLPVIGDMAAQWV